MTWTIKVNGDVFGKYPTEQFARAAFTGVCQSRPKNKYTVVLLNAAGAVSDTCETSITGSRKKERTA